MPLRHRVHSGTELTNAAQTLLTFSNNLVEGGAILWGFMIVNRSASDRQVTVHLVASGGGPAESNCIYEETIPARSSVAIQGPFHENSGAFVSALSTVADSDVGVRLTASEEFLGG